MPRRTDRTNLHILLLAGLFLTAIPSAMAAQTDAPPAAVAPEKTDLPVSTEATADAGRGDCPCGRCRRSADSAGGRGHRGAGRDGQHGPHGSLMREAHQLLDSRESLRRTVEEIPGGVRTVTTTSDPDLVPVLQTHVEKMAELVEGGGRVRRWDPLFVELFDRADEIVIEFEHLKDGIAVVETSTDPEVAKLIRAHAVKVLEFIERGYDAAHEATPLPEGYSGTK